MLVNFEAHGHEKLDNLGWFCALSLLVIAADHSMKALLKFFFKRPLILARADIIIIALLKHYSLPKKRLFEMFFVLFTDAGDLCSWQILVLLIIIGSCSQSLEWLTFYGLSASHFCWCPRQNLFSSRDQKPQSCLYLSSKPNQNLLVLYYSSLKFLNLEPSCL